MSWIERGREFASDASGRFDVLFASAVGRWVAVDWELGRKARFWTRAEAEQWCEKRVLGSCGPTVGAVGA